MTKVKKAIIIIGVLLALFISIFAWPFSLPISLFAFWYFTKKKPKKTSKKYAMYASIISVCGLIMFGTIINSEGFSESTSEKEAPEQVELSEEDIQEQAEKQEEREEQERKEQEEAAQKQKEEEEEEQEEKERKEQEEKDRQEQEEQERKEKEAAEANPNKSNETQAPTESVSVPSGQESVVINDNIPFFSNEDISSTDVYHRNGSLDSLGRVTAANAVVGVEIMPAEERGDIGHHEPTGWNQERYEGIGAGGWLYNRSHLIGHQMTGNDDYANLMTGTRWFNMRMLEYENFVANYVETTENHVRYRVTPIFEGNNLVASGAYMEGFSIEDNGEGLMFNIYVPNIQPDIEINYADGSSVESNASNNSVATVTPEPKPESKPESKPEPKPEPTPEPESKPTSGDIASVDTNGNGTVTISEAKAAGYSMPITSDHWLYKYMIDRDGDGTVGE